MTSTIAALLTGTSVIVGSSVSIGSSIAGPPPRPKILGVAHMAIYVKDLAKAFTLPAKTGPEVRMAFVKVNDRQYLEIFNEADRGEGQLNHISFYTDDADQMREYVASRGVRVPDKVGKGLTGNKNFNITDPDGHIVEIVEYQPTSCRLRTHAAASITPP